MLRLVARCGGRVRWRELGDEPVVLGSSATESDWELRFPGVSRRHVRLEPRDGRALLTDLGSKNGIVVGGRRVETVELSPGETVALGRVLLTLEEVSSSDMHLALRVESDPEASDGDGTGTGAVARETAPLAALRLVRALETLTGAPRDQSDRSAVLSRVAEALGAGSLWAFMAVEDDLFLHDCVGPLPSQTQLQRLADLLEPDGGVRGANQEARELELDDGRAVICQAEASGPWVVATFPGIAGAPNAWRLELLELVAETLHHAAITVEPTVPGRHRAWQGLRLPEEMVVGRSQAMRGLLTHLEAAARSDLPVLLLGETGTGKELVAHALHASTPGRGGPFVAINCAAIPVDLLEVELFGVAARVATGVDPRVGRFLQAAGGTIFLDEIGELPLRLESKLSRVLQEREVLPIGAERPLAVDARIIAASNSDLKAESRAGRFRTDLYYRLAGLELHVPPLRERVQDIPELVLAFVRRCAEKYGLRIRGVSQRALSMLMAYEWPGNVRELENVVERAVLLAADGGALESGHFGSVQWAVERGAQGEPPFEHYRSGSAEGNDPPPGPLPDPGDFRPLQERVDAVEIQAIREALRLTGGNKTRAAELLEITPNGLRTKMRRLGLG